MIHPAFMRPGQDPSEVKFNFFAWRIHRRLLAQKLRERASGEIGKPVTVLRRVADHLDSESMRVEDVQDLAAYLRSLLGEEVSLHSTLDLDEALDRLPTIETQPDGTEVYVMVQPDWAQIQGRTGYFVGQVHGIQYEAALPESDALVPEYALRWPTTRGYEGRVEPLLHAYSTPSLPHGPVIWDFLLAHRLTDACLEGKLDWPENYPLLLQA